MTDPVPDAELVTGVKRDINLLSRIEEVKNCNIAVFDISMHANIASLEQQLAAGNDILYIDHHFAGEIPESDRLTTIIDTAVCRLGPLSAASPSHRLPVRNTK